MNPQNFSTNTICQPTMPFYEFKQYNTLCIQATLGMGKTNTLYDFFEYNLGTKYQNCLILSFRKTLCKKYAKDLNQFEIYDKVDDRIITPEMHPYVICQIDSIKRIRGKYDLVIFDEMTYTMNHLVSSISEKKRCHDAFLQIMTENNDIIIMDALLDKDYVDYISSFNRKISYIINEYTIHNNKQIYNYGTNKTAFIDEMINSLKNGLNIVIATNNKKMLEFIDTIFTNDFKGIKKQFIKKESKTMYDLEQWKSLQVLAYTPSIVAGISYTEKHFDKMFGIFCNTSATADMAMQQLFRVRDISTNEFHICCEVNGKKDYPIDNKSIKELVLNEDKCLINTLDNISIDYIKNDIVEDEYFRLFCIYLKRKFKSCNDYNGELIGLLRKQGITNIKNINTYNEDNKKMYNKKKKEFINFIKENEAKRTADSEDITDIEEESIKESNDITDDDRYKLKKHKIKKILKIKKVTKETIIKYSKSGPVLWNLAYIYGYNDYLSQLNKRINYDEKKIDMSDNTVRLGRRRKYEKMLLCDHMVKYIGFTNPMDRNSINIDREKFKEYISKYHDIIEIYFKCNKFDRNNFNTKNWYSLCKRYINSKLKSVYGISIVEDRKTKTQYIKGLDFWSNEVTYKNIEIIKEIKENEEDLYESEAFEANIMAILDAPIDEEFNYYDTSNSPNSYTEEYKNKKCIDCNNNVINNNIKCLQCKYKNNMFK